jgi:hypothetical protein
MAFVLGRKDATLLGQSVEVCVKRSIDAPPSSLMDSAVSPKRKTTEGKGIGARSLACNTSRVEGRVGALGWD